MKLSSESINDSIRMQETNDPTIYCISSKDKFKCLKKAIISYKGEAKSLEEITNNYNKLSNDVLLVRLDTIDEDEIFSVEKLLIRSTTEKKSIILDISGVNLSIDKRDVALSFLNRYNIDLIIGSRNEFLYLVKNQWQYKNDIVDKYRYFSRKNKIILLVIDNEYFITDGYSEFIIESKKNKAYEDVDLNCILSGIISVAISNCSSKEEKVKSILIAINVFEICKDLTINKVSDSDEITNYSSVLFNEILNINPKTIYDNSKILYMFKR